jgi:hypothetical protein
MTSIRLSRRTLLRGSSLAATAAIPLLDAERVFGQATAAAPTRLVIFTTPNGTRANNFWPTGTETSFTLNTLTSGLQSLKSKLTFLKGVQLNAAVQARGAGSMHARGTGGMLTARPLGAGNFRSFAGNTSGWGTGQSIDQYLAARLAPPTPFKSFHVGVHVRDAEVRARISYSAANQPIPPREDPKDVFSALFAGGASGGSAGGTGSSAGAAPALTRLWAQRKSVFDATLAETQKLQAKVGKEDWIKLQAHIAGMRDVEQRLVGTPGTTAPPMPAVGCSPPTLQAVDLQSDDQYAAAGQLQMDLAAAALACDQTRILTFQWSYAESEHLFQFLNVNGSHHVISHDNSAAAGTAYDTIETWYAQQFSYFLNKLDSYKEGERTLLDNCVVLWTSEIGDGITHDLSTLPCLLAGSAGGRIRAGRFIDFTSNRRDNNQMLISLAHAMGAEDLTTFGDPSGAMGPLPGLT